MCFGRDLFLLRLRIRPTTKITRVPTKKAGISTPIYAPRWKVAKISVQLRLPNKLHYLLHVDARTGYYAGGE